MKKTIRLSKRDKSLLESLGQHHILSTKQIKRLFFEDVKDIRTVLFRLRKLKKFNFLRRFRFGEYGQCVWALGKKAQNKFGTSHKFKGLNKNSLNHDLIANDIKIHLEKSGYGIDYVSGFYLRHREATNRRYFSADPGSIPDWIMTAFVNKRACGVAIECEVTYKGKRRMDSVFGSLSRLQSVDFIWYIVPTENLKKRLIKNKKEYDDGKSKENFWFSTFDEFFKDKDKIKFSTTANEYLAKDIFIKPDALKKVS